MNIRPSTYMVVIDGVEVDYDKGVTNLKLLLNSCLTFATIIEYYGDYYY